MSSSPGLWRAVAVGVVIGVSVGVGISLFRAPGPPSAPEMKQALADYERRRALEYSALEEAEWFGKTGLDDATERELPRYLRREFGEFIDDPEGLRAADLEYIGVFAEAGTMVHYWRIPHGGKEVFAYAEVSQNRGVTLGWGGQSPPNIAANAP